MASAFWGGRMDYDQILPQLLVGSRPRTVTDIAALVREKKVSAVLNLQTDEDMVWHDTEWSELQEYYSETGVELARVPVRDFDPQDLREKLPRCVAALDRLLQKGGVVYVHCTAGVNRSPTVAVAYLHRCQGWELERAATFVMERRNCSPEVEAIRLAAWGTPESGSSLPDG